jgi:hypothetical protein
MRVGHGLETIEGSLANPLRRGVRVDQLGVRLFEIPELGEQLIVLEIRDLGCCTDVVEVIVVPDEPTKLDHPES